MNGWIVFPIEDEQIVRKIFKDTIIEKTFDPESKEETFIFKIKNATIQMLDKTQNHWGRWVWCLE